jgi:hypothetical protein
MQKMRTSVVCADKAWNEELAEQMYCWSENLAARLMNGPTARIPQNDGTRTPSTAPKSNPKKKSRLVAGRLMDDELESSATNHKAGNAGTQFSDLINVL